MLLYGDIPLSPNIICTYSTYMYVKIYLYHIAGKFPSVRHLLRVEADWVRRLRRQEALLVIRRCSRTDGASVYLKWRSIKRNATGRKHWWSQVLIPDKHWHHPCCTWLEKSQGKILKGNDLSHVPFIDFWSCILSSCCWALGKRYRSQITFKAQKKQLHSTDLYRLVHRISYNASSWLMNCNNPKVAERPILINQRKFWTLPIWVPWWFPALTMQSKTCLWPPARISPHYFMSIELYNDVKLQDCLKTKCVYNK